MASNLVCNIDKHFVNLTDPRVNRGTNHNLIEMTFMAVVAALCGCQGWVDVERFVLARWDWFARRIPMERGVPSHDTFGRVFSKLDTDEFFEAMHAWVDDFATSLRGQGIAIDGKTLRGSFDAKNGQSPLHTITAFATGTRLCLRQMLVADKSNEIPAVPEILKLLDLAGATVTLDAMHCQAETLTAIIDAKADYLVSVKRNQAALYEHVKSRFEDRMESDFQGDDVKQFTQQERGHGRDELRRHFVLGVDDSDRAALERWPGVTSLMMVYRERLLKDGTETHEIEFYMSSHAPRATLLARHAREHWGIETRLHYVLDVTFTEDASRIRSGSAPAISGAIRRMALNILRNDTTVKDNIRGKRLRAGWSEAVLTQILAGFKAK